MTLFGVLLVALAVGLAAAQTPTPHCQPYPGIDFYNLGQGYCLNMTEILNGVNSGTFDFYFNWCSYNNNVPTCFPWPPIAYETQGLGCARCELPGEPSYVVKSSVMTCGMPFMGWTTGMAYNAQTQQVSYVVNDGTGTTASITVQCDTNGAAGSIGCPSSYTVSGTVPISTLLP